MKYLEFYSGIGGHRCAINELVERSSSTSSTSSAIHVERSSSTSSSIHSNCCSCLHNTTPICLGAFDVSTSANDTYLANFPNHKPTQKPIERLTTKQLDTYNADLWVMSPPCQPYTRQRANQPSSKKDVNDRRAASFTHLTTVLAEMSNPPRFILLENVVGFETSESCRNWLSTLSRCKYQVDQFHLSPIQFGIPNNRPRYFCIAKRLQSSHQCTESNVDTYNKSKSSSGTASNGSKSDKSDSSNNNDNNDNNDSSNNNDNNDNNKTTTPSTTLHTSLKSFLQKKQRNVTCQCWLNNTFTSPSSSGPSTLFSYLEYQGQSHTNMSSSLVPLSMLSRSFSEVVDLVTPSSTTSCCFTKSYGTYLKGTGSLVVMEKELGDSISLLGGSSNTIEEMNRKKMTESNGSEGESGSEQRPIKRVKTELSTPEEPWHIKFGTDRVRYFTPKEISKLLGFPSTHVFHESVSLKKKYALLGNSLHVGTVARLLHVLLSDE